MGKSKENLLHSVSKEAQEAFLNLESKEKDAISSMEDLGILSIADDEVKSIIELFDKLCLPFDEGKGEKEKVFHELLEAYGGSYEEGIGYVVHSVNECKRVIVSHMDLIKTFNKGFAKEKKYKIGKSSSGEHILMGALDNTFTNAILMKALIELRDENLAQDTTFVFTEREEIDFGGMKGYLRKYSTEPLFINLDVTPDNRKYNTSIEFDEPNWGICKQIQNQKDVFTAGFTTDRVGDDTDAVLSAGAQGFSYCIPTYKTIHSYSNYTKISNILPYYKGMLFLIDGLDLSEGIECDIKELSLKEALKIDTKKKLIKKEKKAKKERENRRKSLFDGHRSSRSSYSSSSYSSRTFMDRDYFADDVEEFSYLEQLNKNRLQKHSANAYIDWEDEELENYMVPGLFELHNQILFFCVNDLISEKTDEIIDNYTRCLVDFGYADIPYELNWMLSSLSEGSTTVSLNDFINIVCDNYESFSVDPSDDEKISLIADDLFHKLKVIGCMELVSNRLGNYSFYIPE